MIETNVISLREYHNKRKHFFETKEEIRKNRERESFLIEMVNQIKIKETPFLKNTDFNNKSEEKRLYHRKCRIETLERNFDLFNNFKGLKVINKSHFQSNIHFVVDHKVSIDFGFKNCITVEDICSESNLRWISSKKNALKAAKIFFDSENEYLIKKYNLTNFEHKIFNETYDE